MKVDETKITICQPFQEKAKKFPCSQLAVLRNPADHTADGSPSARLTRPNKPKQPAMHLNKRHPVQSMHVAKHPTIFALIQPTNSTYCYCYTADALFKALHSWFLLLHFAL